MPTIDPSIALRPQASPDAWLLVLLLGGGYLYLLSAWGPTSAPTHLRRRGYATRQQKILYFTGVLVFGIGASSPIHNVGENYLYSFHMVQHLMFQLVAAPLLILGTPAWMLRRMLVRPKVQPEATVLTKPLVALLLVNAFVATAHTPQFVEATLSNGLFHLFTHFLWVAVGLLMWWPVTSPLPEVPHYSYLGRMGYLFSHSILPTVPASFLTFASAPLYSSYENAPRIWEFITPLVDLQIAGLLMKIGGGLLLWAVIAALFFRWSHEDRTGGPDALYWRDFAGTDQTPELVKR